MRRMQRTGVKVAVAMLLVLCICFTAISGVMTGLLAVSGSYGEQSSLYQILINNRMQYDMNRVMNHYFDPWDPQNPWKSYYRGGVYTGEGSNFRYSIEDPETGYSVLSTVQEGDMVIAKRFSSHGFDSTSDVPLEAYDVGNATLIEVDGTFYVYDRQEGGFFPSDGAAEPAVYLPESAEEKGFLFYDEETGEGQRLYRYFDGTFLKTDEATEPEYIWKEYIITGYVLSDLEVRDDYWIMYRIAQFMMDGRWILPVLFVAGLVLSIVLLVLLMKSVGRRYGSDFYLPLIFRLPTDVTILVVPAIMITLAALLVEVTYYAESSLLLTLCALLLLLLGEAILGVYLLCFIAARVKVGSLWGGMLLVRLWRKGNQLLGTIFDKSEWMINKLPLVWKVAVVYVGICLIEFCLLMMTVVDGFVVFLWMLLKLVLGLGVGYVTLAFRRLKEGAETIARGDYYTHVDESYLLFDFKDTADTLNHIQDGMNRAVDSRMRSERLKTELITNVSHDLKTPLTSIVNYVDLLKQEPAGSPAAEEYLEVLDRQSARMKKLIEDLVEASKASTGNLNMNLEPLDVSTVLEQAVGEYSLKLEQAGLTPVLRVPEVTGTIMADGRLLWRVFDNLLGNMVKYGLAGTRAYFTVESGAIVTVTFRNISAEPLNVTAEELMERFVRGDSSRHTEGSGLGLSIARSLVENMGGTFSISVDGDLFKAEVSFPVWYVERNNNFSE